MAVRYMEMLVPHWLNSVSSGQTPVRGFWETASGVIINLRFLALGVALKRS